VTLEEEKKLVAEKLGFMLGKAHTGHTTIGVKIFLDFIILAAWNPQTQIQWWPEILEKIGKDGDLRELFIQNLDVFLDFTMTEYDSIWNGLTAKPKICWKALIKTLGQS